MKPLALQPTARELAFRRIIRAILRAHLPEAMYLRLYWRFLRNRARRGE